MDWNVILIMLISTFVFLALWYCFVIDYQTGMAYTVNVLKFWKLTKVVVIRGENACQNSKQGRPDQTASSEAVWSGSALFVYDFLFKILEHLLME